MHALEEAIHSSLGCPENLGSLLCTLVSDGTVTTRVNTILASLMTDTTALVDVAPSRMVLARGKDFLLSIRRISATASDSLEGNGNYLSSTCSNSVYLFQAGQSATVRRFAIPPGIDMSVFRSGVKLVQVDENPYLGGALYETINDGFVYDYSAPQGATMVRLDYAPYANLAWYFDRKSLTSTFPSAAHVSQTTLECLAQVLGALKTTASLPYLLALASHSSHFVRWAAIQAVGKIDRAAAIDLLEKAALDAHPEVRSAARKILAS